MALTPYVPSSSWLARPRSADPYVSSWLPPAYPPSSRPFYGNASHDYLAGLWQAVNARRLNEALVIDDWVFNCPDLDLEYGNPLSRADVLEAFENLIALVNFADRGQLETSIQHQLLLDLEGAMQADQAVQFPYDRRVTFETQHLFRSLSYVSYCCRSLTLGRVLHAFFTQYIRWIAQNNCRRSLWQWCNAIMESGMADCLKRDCISQLNILRGDVFEPNNARGQDRAVRKLAHLVRELLDALRGDASLVRRRPSRHNSSPRGLWPDNHDPLYSSSSEEKRDREKLKDDLRYHEKEAERSRKKLAKLEDEKYGYGIRYSKPRSYRQRRGTLKDSWTNGNLWSSDDEP